MISIQKLNGLKTTEIWLAAFLSFFFYTGIAQEVRPLSVEPNHSTIQFSIPISNGITRVTGKFTNFSIDLDYIDEDLTKSKLTAIIKAASINTGIPDRDDHLRTVDFFDTEKYPEITFLSDSIVKVDEHYIAFGKFQMHGVTKFLELPLKLTGIDGKNTLGLSSRLAIKRSDYGVGVNFKHTDMENFLGDVISIEIDFWTRKRKK